MVSPLFLFLSSTPLNIPTANPQATTRRFAIERRDQQLREKDMARESLVKQLNNDAIFRKNLDSDDRVENKRRLRSLREREEEERKKEELLEVRILCVVVVGKLDETAWWNLRGSAGWGSVGKQVAGTKASGVGKESLMRERN